MNNKLNSISINEIFLGDTAKISKKINEEDVLSFANITNDSNLVHLDEEYAKNTRFGARIAHGMLIGSLISAVIGTKLPGLGTIYKSQLLSFLAPVYLGDTITASVEVVDINYIKKEIKLRTMCVNQNGKVVVDGEAIVLPPRQIK